MLLSDEIKDNSPLEPELPVDPVLLTYEEWEQIHSARERLRGQAEIKLAAEQARITSYKFDSSHTCRVSCDFDRLLFRRMKFLERNEVAKEIAYQLALKIIHEMTTLAI